MSGGELRDVNYRTNVAMQWRSNWRMGTEFIHLEYYATASVFETESFRGSNNNFEFFSNCKFFSLDVR